MSTQTQRFRFEKWESFRKRFNGFRGVRAINYTKVLLHSGIFETIYYQHGFLRIFFTGHTDKKSNYFRKSKRKRTHYDNWKYKNLLIQATIINIKVDVDEDLCVAIVQ